MKTSAILLSAVLLGSAAQASAQQPQPDPDDPTDTDDPIEDPADPDDDTQPADPAEPAPVPEGTQPDTTTTDPDTTAQPQPQPMVPPPTTTEPVVVQPEPTETETHVTVTPTPVRVTPVQEEEKYVDRIGLALTLGAGVSTFIDADTRDFTNPGGGWGARLSIGTRELLGLELGYSGTAQEIDALGLDNDAILVSNGLDAALRLNLGPELPVQPFLFGGLGWRHFNVTNADTNTSSIKEEDDVLEFPVGAGIAFKAGGAALELRTTFRPVTDSDLMGGRDEFNDPGDVDPGDLDPDDIDDPAARDSKSTLHSWGATLAVGFDF